MNGRSDSLSATWYLLSPIISVICYHLQRTPHLAALIYFFSWFCGVAGVHLLFSCQGSNHASLMPQMVKNLPAMQETQVQSLDSEDPMEKGVAAHSSILAWKIPWKEEPGGLQSTWSQRVRRDWAASTFSHAVAFSWELSWAQLTMMASDLSFHQVVTFSWGG